MLSRVQFVDYLSVLKLSFSDAAQLLGVSERSVRRWAEGETVPGPVDAALRAWKLLDAQRLPWKPDSVSIIVNDQDQIQLIQKHSQMLYDLIREVEGRGGPSTYWAVDLAKQRATLGSAEVSFYRLEQGGFSEPKYRRVDRAPSEQDRHDMQDACYCIAQAIARARDVNKAIIELAEYTRNNSASFITDGSQILSDSQLARQIMQINICADDLNGLASSALQGNALYANFESILDALHRLGFFPEQSLVSKVAHSMIGPAPRPDIPSI